MKKICFAASSGGHLVEIMNLKPIMSEYDSFIITEKTQYPLTDHQIRTYNVCQVNRHELLCIFKLCVIALRAFCCFCKEKPDIVISTGALATVPICLIGKLFRKKVIYIESYANVDSPSKTGRLVYRFADRFYVQWQALLEFYPNARFIGGIF